MDIEKKIYKRDILRVLVELLIISTMLIVLLFISSKFILLFHGFNNRFIVVEFISYTFLAIGFLYYIVFPLYLLFSYFKFEDDVILVIDYKAKCVVYRRNNQFKYVCFDEIQKIEEHSINTLAGYEVIYTNNGDCIIVTHLLVTNLAKKIPRKIPVTTSSKMILPKMADL
jgi:hypothetical protein